MRSVTLISMMFMMTMPPTTIPMQTTAGIAVKRTRVSWRQNATSASALSTVKSFVLARPEPVGDAHRLLGARHRAGSIASALAILTETTVVFRRP